jgi:hypothetical protein
MAEQPAAEQAPYRESRITLAAVVTAVSCSRWYVRLMLQHWGLTAVVDTAELLTSELVTNAVRATGVLDPKADPTELRGVSLIRIQVTAFEGSVFLAVWDSDPTMPLIEAHDMDDEHGRGLLLVSALSRRWSAYPSPQGGKVVWCEIELPSPTTAAGLPNRRRRACSPRPAADVIRDRATLLRVRDALLAL